MISILPQAQSISYIVPKQIYDDTKQYRLSKYTVVIEYKDHMLLFNTLTREMLALNYQEYNNILNNRDLYKKLIEKFFYVEEHFNEKNLSSQISKIAESFNKANAITNFIVYSTTDCNARCFYCFEYGAKRYHMNEKTAEDVADFIEKKSKGKKVTIQWFGGEPLCNIKVIDIIAGRLKERNVKFLSQMVTNGYLFIEDIAIRAKENWNLQSLQITLDGTREIYNKIKNYFHRPNDDAFDKVISNIETAIKHGIKVSIRVNMDKHNCDDVFDLIKYLCKKFAGHEKMLSIYGSLLYDNCGTKKSVKNMQERMVLTESLLMLEDYIFKHGFHMKTMPKKEIVSNMCYADSERCLTILPNGSIGKCEHYSDDNMVGSIYNDSINESAIKKWKERRDEETMCSSCPLYPQCVKLKHCPTKGDRDCDVSYQNIQLYELYTQMKNAYDISDIKKEIMI